MEQYFDNVGNEIKVGDEVLILVPKSDASYRPGIIKDFKNAWKRDNYFHCEVLVEYDDGRLYCDKKHYQQNKGDILNFNKKHTKAWRYNSDIIKLRTEYLND